MEVLKFGAGWLCVNKPRGLLVHPAKGSEDDLLGRVKELLEAQGELAEGVGWNGQYSPSAVHRLDREVSGAVLIGVDGRILPQLHRQFEEGTTQKVYRAWCRRVKSELADEGVWRYPLTRKAEGRSKPAGFHRFRVPCETLYSVLRRNDDKLELELELKTGRKHQLRRHCALAGHPIQGDPRYGVEGDDGNLLLHSRYLAFSDPGHGGRIEVEASLPEGWSALSS